MLLAHPRPAQRAAGMTRRGRPAKVAITPYVLTHEEVVRDYFRRSPASLTPEALAAENPTFPRPNRAGLYHRAAVERWVDATFGLRPPSEPLDPASIALERALGRRQNQASSA